MKKGLILGKFAPLHKGHQYLIETALKEVDELYIMIYDCPEVTDISLEVRAGWITTLYPGVHMIEARDKPEEGPFTPERMKRHEEYVMAHVPEGITHVFSSEAYGAHMARALEAAHIIVDKERARVPISATTIRNNPEACREFLDPVVAKDVLK